MIFAHGYDVGPAEPLAPTRFAEFLSRGYAFAQSRYRAHGWAVKEGIEDTDALRRYLVRRYGRPREMYIAGESMGGMITVATAERYPGAYDGALPLCGVVSPATRLFRERLWDMMSPSGSCFPAF